MEQLISKEQASRLRSLLFDSSSGQTKRALVAVLAGVAILVGALLVFLTPPGGVAIIIAGIGALLMLRDIRWALYALLLVVCLLPFGSLPFRIGFTPTFLDLVFGALYAVWVMRLITRQQRDFILTPLGLPVLIFCTLALFSFVLGLSHSRPTSNDLRTFAEVLMGFGMFFLTVNCVRTEELIRSLTAVAILAGAAEAVVGITLYTIPTDWTVRLLSPLGRLGYPTGFGALRFINDDPGRPMRAIGTNIDPNILGALLIVLMTIAIAQLFARRPALPRLWVALAVALMGICLFMTYSRASMLGATAAIGLIALLRYRRLLLIMVVVGVLVLLLPQTQAYISHFVEGIQIQDRSTQMRMGEYRDTWRLIQRYPWLGVGFVGTPDIDLYIAVASLYLAVTAKMGIVGLLAFLLTIGVFFIYVLGAWQQLPRGSPLEPYLLGYGAAVFGSLVSGVLDHTLLTYPHAVALLWMTMGMATVTAQRVRDQFSR